MKKGSKFIIKSAAVTLLLVLVSSIALLLLYPNWSNFQNLKSEIQTISRPREIVYKIFVQALTSISPPVSAQVTQELTQEGALEFINKEELKKFNYYGNPLYDLSAKNTTLQIDTLNIDGKVLDGDDAFTMDKGFWHYPLSALPGAKGNFVVIGHRFGNIPPNTETFFNLDKAKVGEKITITQNNDDYTYIITESRVVEKNERSVLDKTNDYRITIITCHPLWSSDQRLVVVGKLDKIYRNI